jgi:hypothetical protein
VAIFVGLDVHRAQITYDALDTDSGEVRAGRIRPANRGTVRALLTRLATRETVVAVEAMTGWRFIAEECVRAGIDVRLAEPAETRMRQDRKRRGVAPSSARNPTLIWEVFVKSAADERDRWPWVLAVVRGAGGGRAARALQAHMRGLATS